MFKKQKTIHSDKQYQEDKLKECFMRSSPGINIRFPLFLIYVNELQYASNLLDPITFADDIYFMLSKTKKLVGDLYPTNLL